MFLYSVISLIEYKFNFFSYFRKFFFDAWTFPPHKKHT